MDDHEIVDLYWQRDEHAIEATAAKYESYCGCTRKTFYPTAPTVRKTSTTRTYTPGRQCRRKGLRSCLPFSARSRAIWR